MSDSIIALCEVDLYLPGVLSLKEKRGLLKSMLTRMRKTFNVSTAEVASQDHWQSATIAIVTVSNSSVYAQQRLQKALSWMEKHFPDAVISDHSIEII